MRNNLKKLIACALAAMLGLSNTPYFVHAQEAQSQQKDVGETPKADGKADRDLPTAKASQTNLENSGQKSAQNEVKNAGDFNVTGGAGWTYSGGENTLTFNSSGTYKVTGDGNETSENIVVADNFKGTVTIENINIEGGRSAFEVKNTANLTLNLEGQNKLVSSAESCAGLKFENAVTGSLRIDGTGSLDVTARGRYGAGIGGCTEWSTGGNITIAGGTVTATGGLGAAGIGGAQYAQADNIMITGGTVIANGGGQGAGIGSGYTGQANHITVTGGTVIANSGDNAAGIGNGDYGSADNITISGGIVTANGYGIRGSGIESGSDSENGIRITGGEVTATGKGDYTAGIKGKITITGGAVVATGGWKKPGIGGKTMIAGGTVTASGNEAPGIDVDSGDYTEITGGSVKTNSIGGQPTNGESQNVYRAKVGNLSGINEVTVDGSTYTRAGDHPDGDGAFYLYLTGKDHNIKADGKSYVAQWYNSSFTVKQKPQAPSSVSGTSPSASSITIDEPSGAAMYGGAEYSMDGNTWQASNTFGNLKAATTYTVYVRYKGNRDYLVSGSASASVTTNPASYTITIPADPSNPLVAGNQESKSTISVNTSRSFDLGHNGQVDVRVKNGGSVSADGKLTLTRVNAGNTILSALLVGGNPFQQISTPIVTFTMENKDTEKAAISFAKPEGAGIPAGTYNGSVTFEVSYNAQ